MLLGSIMVSGPGTIVVPWSTFAQMSQHLLETKWIAAYGKVIVTIAWICIYHAVIAHASTTTHITCVYVVANNGYQSELRGL